MNWLGANPLALLGGALGAALGVLVFGALHARGLELPLCVGVCAGLGCAVATAETNVMRGLVVGTLAAWGGAVAHTLYISGAPLWTGLAEFHRDLSPLRFVLHVASIVLAVALGSSSLQKGARSRLAGS